MQEKGFFGNSGFANDGGSLPSKEYIDNLSSQDSLNRNECLKVRLNNLFEKNCKIVCFEVNPPKGIDYSSIFQYLQGNTDGIDFFNVTDSALAKMKASPMGFASILKHKFDIDSFVNFTCRDRNVLALQADLLSGWMLGVRSVVALTGDAVSLGDLPDAKPVFEVNSVSLLSLIQKLNSGVDLAGSPLKGKPDYCCGVVVNPNAKNSGAELRRLQKKKDAGAAYALSQPVFDEEQSRVFFSEARSVGIPILMGLMPFKSYKSAKSLERIPGIKLSQKVIDYVDANPEKDFSEYSINHCLRLAEINQENVQGYHIISGTTPRLALQLTKEIVRKYKNQVS
jgi:5,10-methylenetetrahydrofolate reductase